MRIENEMLSRFNKVEHEMLDNKEINLSQELDLFFDNVMGTVVDFFKEETYAQEIRKAYDYLCKIQNHHLLLLQKMRCASNAHLYSF